MPTSNLSVLVVEDDDYKAKALSDFIVGEWPCVNISMARSLNSAIRQVCEKRYELILVDMSLPTYDLSRDPHGGGPEGFAGEDILRFIESESPGTKMVVVTQLSEFSDGSVTRTLEELTTSLEAEFGSAYLGLVSYSGRHGGWRDALKKMLQGVSFE